MAQNYIVDHIQIYFDAPPKYAAETLTLEADPEKRKNFQWSRYVLWLSNKNDDDEKYVYERRLEPWGTKQNTPSEVTATDKDWNRLPEAPIKLTPKEIETQFKNLLEKPDLDPSGIAGLGEGLIQYINENEKEKNKKYRPAEFKRIFEESEDRGVRHYLLMSKEMLSPLGEKVEIKPKGKFMNAHWDVNRMAVRAAKEATNYGQDAMSGGFDIMKKLFVKQHKEKEKAMKKKK